MTEPREPTDQLGIGATDMTPEIIQAIGTYIILPILAVIVFIKLLP